MRRPAIVLATLIVATLALSGCDVLAPTRDTSGNITMATEMPSTDARVKDCFTFVDGSDLAYATVLPCTEAHTHVVIARGTITQAKIAEFESLQIALITRCQPAVDAYLTEQDDDGTPEYIVSTKRKPNGNEVTNYSCLMKSAAP